MKQLSILVGVLFMLSFVLALDVSEELSTNIILDEYDDPIEMKLVARNASLGTYNIYTFADVTISPAEIFQHDGGVIEKTFSIIKNANLKKNGLYVVKYTLNHRGVEQVDRKITLNLLSIADVLDISTETITIEDSEARIVVKNLENIDLENIEIAFSSVLFSHTEVIRMKADEEKSITVALDPEKLKKTKAGTYVIDVEIQTPKGKVDASGRLYLNEKREIRSEEDIAGLLIRTTTIYKTNIGNSVEDVGVTIDKNILSRLFTSYNIDPTSTQRSGVKITYTWNDRIYPDENLKVVVRTNWVLPFLIILAIILSYMGISRFLQKKLEIKKSVTVVKTKGGDFALKVHLNLKARKSIENVSLIDRISPMVKLYNKFGTIKPTKIDAHNRQLQWIIGDLDAGEERILDYIIYSKVGVLGKFALPRARAVFEKDGQIQETTSNSVFFLSDQSSKG
jgi:hypothetical protein